LILIRRIDRDAALDVPAAPSGARRQQRSDDQQQGSRCRPAQRSRAAIACVAAAVAVLGGCASPVDESHGPSVVEPSPPPPTATKARSTTIAAPPSFVQRIEGTTVTVEMVRIAVATADAPALWMSRTEIPWDLYDVFLYGLDGESTDDADGVSRPSKPYVPPDRGFGHAGYPAMGMTFHAAESFCHWLSVNSGRTYRLPTETEWASACATGSAESELDELAWHAANASNKTHPIAGQQPSTLGLHDMLGNVAEWARGDDGKAIACGGSYLDAPESLTCDARQRQTPAWNTSDPQIPKSRWWLADCSFVGLRIVCEGDATVP
jgi:formylglycine-generating enzyme required for sulfatase activity